jgi:hypothetical protein
MGALGEQVFEFEAANYHKRAHEILKSNPPGPTVQQVYLQTPAMDFRFLEACNGFSWGQATGRIVTDDGKTGCAVACPGAGAH